MVFAGDSTQPRRKTRCVRALAYVNGEKGVTKQSQTVEVKSDHKNRPHVEPALVSEPEWGSATLPELAMGPVGVAGDGLIDARATRLADPRFQTVQRQAMASQAGHMQGNQYLQRFILSLRGDDKDLPYPPTNGGKPADYQYSQDGGAVQQRMDERIAEVEEEQMSPASTESYVRTGARLAPPLNQSLSWRLAPMLVQREDGQPTAEDDPAERCAQAVYDALDGWNDEPAALRALQGHDQALSRRIEERFQARYHQSLRGYLRNQLSGDWLVRAFALLNSMSYHEHHTAMALALIPLDTRDTEVWRILDSLPLSGRQEMERRYDETFREIGEGSLKADLRGDLSGWALEKSLALLNHDLKSAEHLYFDSVAITGTHTQAVVSRIQSEWGKGPSSFAQFERDWDQYVRSQPPESSEPAWTSMGLREAMESELSGEEWELVRAVLDGHRAYQRGVGVEVGPLSEDQLFQQEEIQLQVAESTLTAATTGGFTGLGTNEDHVFRAVSTIRQIWQQRIERADRAGDMQHKVEYENRWNQRRQQLIASIPSEMDEDTADFRRVRLLTLGELTPADEVYLAGEALDYDRVRSLVTRYWAQGKMEELLSQASTERTAAVGGSQTVVRPRFNVDMIVPVTQGIGASRIFTLTRSDDNDAGRGARRLKLELDEGDNDSDLRRSYEMLTTDDINPGLRSSVIETFVSRNLSSVQGDTAVQKFLTYIDQRYEGSNTCWEFRDLLAPATDPSEMVRRARGRLAASRTGALDIVLGGLTDAYGAMTGEDTEAVAEESLERLHFIAHTAGAHPEELAAMMAMTGREGPAQLAGMEYEQFRARLEELRALKRSIAEALATAIELTIETAITIATAGTAAPALLATLSATVAGMVAREALLGQDYDLVSAQNAQQLALTVASAGFGTIGTQAAEGLIDAERLQRMGRVGTFMREAISEGITQAGVGTLTAGFEGKLPTAENIAAGALSIVGSAVASGTRGAIRHDLAENLPIIQRLRVEVTARVSQNLISAVSEEGTGLIREGMGNRTWAEVTVSLGHRAGAGIARALVSGAGDVAATYVETQRRAAAERRAQGEPEAMESPGRDLNEEAGEPSRVAGDMEASPTAAASDAPGVIAIAVVNPQHTMGLVRHGDRTITVNICSGACTRLRDLLQDAQQRGVAGTDTYLRQIDALEQRINQNPTDRDIQAELGRLSQAVGTLIHQAGEAAVFGPTATTHAEEEGLATERPTLPPGEGPQTVPPLTSPRPTVTEEPGGWLGRWPDDPRARVLVEPRSNYLRIVDVYRGNQPVGSAGQMVAEVILAAQSQGLQLPSRLRLSNLQPEPSRLAHEAGHAAENDPVFGGMIQSLMAHLGRSPRSIRYVVELDHLNIDIDI